MSDLSRSDSLERGVVPAGRYANEERSPIVWVRLCPWCAGFAPFTTPDYEGFLAGRCQGCGMYFRELHRFRAYIDSEIGCADNGCADRHPKVHGDLCARPGRG